jgi:hypothetical protein
MENREPPDIVSQKIDIATDSQKGNGNLISHYGTTGYP